VNAANGDPVKLSFQHALSRILFQARSGVKDVDFVITRVTLENLFSEAKFNLGSSEIPSSSAGFVYTSGDHTQYTTLWGSHANEANYDVTLPGGPVYLQANQAVGAFTMLHPEVNALMVIPQTITNNLVIDYKLAGSDKVETASLPVCIPGTLTPLTVQPGRQYTFNITISAASTGTKAVTFDVDVADWADYPRPVPVPAKEYFAYSNIFWDALANGGVGGLNFYTDANTLAVPTTRTADVDACYYQGLFFRWGSLIGLDPSKNWDTTSIAYLPAGDGKHTQSTSYPLDGNAPKTIDTSLTQTGGLSDNYATATWKDTGYRSTDSNEYGDICAYLTNGVWRLPTAQEFDNFQWTEVTNGVRSYVSLADGTAIVNHLYVDNEFGVKLVEAGNAAAKTMNQNGGINYWTSSISSTLNTESYSFTENTPSYVSSRRSRGHAIRCIKD
jgi:uncharacterized protein (TIGR02145 family)